MKNPAAKPPASGALQGTKQAWSPERRARQSAMMKARKIWLKSTGPKTAQGKAVSSRNACKPACPDAAANRAARNFLRQSSRLLRHINMLIWRETLRRRALKALHKVDQHLAAHIHFGQNELLGTSSYAPHFPCIPRENPLIVTPSKGCGRFSGIKVHA